MCYAHAYYQHITLITVDASARSGRARPMHYVDVFDGCYGTMCVLCVCHIVCCNIDVVMLHMMVLCGCLLCCVVCHGMLFDARVPCGMLAHSTLYVVADGL